MSPPPALPAPVLALLAAIFPDAPLRAVAPTRGGFSNLSVVARIGAECCVVKAAERPAKVADLRHEANMLDLVAGRRLAAPTLLAFRAGQGWAVLVTRRRPGTPGVALFAGPPAALEPACYALGRTLARLHSTPLGAQAAVQSTAHARTNKAPEKASPSPSPPSSDHADLGDLLLARRAQALVAHLATLPLSADLRGPLEAALRHEAWRPRQVRLVHGDAGLHNILWGRRGLTLLDWELAGWGDPRLDLAWAAWTMRFRGLPPALWEALLAGYGRERAACLGLADEALSALALGQIAGLLARAAGHPGHWEEWQRRARATLQLNKITPG